MKLYATTTSERASKGQGGNEYLEIVITEGTFKNVLTKIVIKPSKFQLSNPEMEIIYNPHLIYANLQEANNDFWGVNNKEDLQNKGKQKKDEPIHESEIIRNEDGDEIEQ